MHDELNEREIQVLEAIVRNYIMTASPTGSRFISKLEGFNLSSATIRNVMGDLEDKEYIAQPHTSAGRIPTDKGYRFYVDRLVSSGVLPDETKNKIREELENIETSDLRTVMDAASHALSKATDQLGIVLSPKLQNAVLETFNIFKIDTMKYVMNITVSSGFVKTFVVEIKTDLPQDQLATACNIINTTFRGKTLREIFFNDENSFSQLEEYDLGVIRMFIPSIQKMMEKESQDSVYTEGKTNVILKPEFFNKEQAGSIIEILEEKKTLMHMFEGDWTNDKGVVVSIGGEMEDGKFESFSVVKRTYQIGSMQGTLGVIGPKRMEYPLLIQAVDYTAKLLEDLYNKNSDDNKTP